MQNDEPPFVAVLLTTLFGFATLTYFGVSALVKRQRRNLRDRLWATIIQRGRQ